MKITRGVLICLAGILLLLSVSALSEEAGKISLELNSSSADMQEIIDAGFSIALYNDTLIAASQMYEAQLALETTGKTADFSEVKAKIYQLNELKRKSFIVFDELNALKKTIDEAEGIENKSLVLDLYEQAAKAFDSERYDEAGNLVDQAYNKISELEALQTKVKAFYDATTRGVISFLKQRWIELTVLTAVIIIVYYLTHDKIAIAIIKRKIIDLENRKSSINKLIADTQRKFFEAGNMDESTYRIRTKKCAELIRDINRQIPTLKEEIEIRKTHIKKE